MLATDIRMSVRWRGFVGTEPLARISRHAVGNAIGYAHFYSRSHDAVIRVCDAAGNVIETHEHTGDFNER